MSSATEWDIQRVWKEIGDLQMRVARLEKEKEEKTPPRPTGWAIIRPSVSFDGIDIFCGEHGFAASTRCKPQPIGCIQPIPTWFPFDDDNPAAVISLLDLKGARVALLYRDTLEEVELR